MSKQPVLMITDLGWEIDDQLALAYICGSPELDLAGVVTTSFYPEENSKVAYAMMAHLGFADRPIGIGTHVCDISAKREPDRLFERGDYPGFWRQPVNGYSKGTELIHKTIHESSGDLNILITAPMVDLAKIIEADKSNFQKVKRIYMQASATGENEYLIPDNTAYNIRADEKAAETVFGIQNRVSITIVGKHAAYQIPLDHPDFFDWIHHPVGYYLNTESLKIVDFGWENPEAYQKIYGGMSSQVLSVPYDALAAVAIARPDLFSPTSIGSHKLIGMNPEDRTVPDKDLLKKHLVQIIGQSMK